MLLIHNIIAPYRFPLFRSLAAHPDIDLTVWFMAESAKNRRWRLAGAPTGFNYEVLPRLEFNLLSKDLFTYVLNYSFPWRYARRHFDVMISAGWLDFSAQAGFFLSKLLGRKFILWSESTANEPSWRRTISLPLVRTMVRGADACISVGTRSREYLLSLGASPDKTFTAFSTVDIEHFRDGSDRARLDKGTLKNQLGITTRRVVLFSGQFIERKGIRYLVEAFAQVQSRYPDVALVLLGYGPLKEEIDGLARRMGVRHMHFLDHVEVDEIPRIYAVADLLVLPSLEETWGLVVNEAMACGLPVVVSDAAGCSVDLVRDGVNGYVVPPRDVTTLADRIERIIADDENLAAFSEQSRALIMRFTPEEAARNFASAVKYAAGRRTDNSALTPA